MGKVLRDTNHIGQLGISWLQWIIEGQWACGVEVVSAHNDNSLDILILLKRRDGKKGYRGATGDVIFAQVKTGYVKTVPTGPYKIQLGKDYVTSHRPRWLSFPGPVIMINVIPPKSQGSNPTAFWTDLRNPLSYAGSGDIIFDPKRTLAGLVGKSAMFNLCWRWTEFRKLPRIEAPRGFAWSKNLPDQNVAVHESIHERSKKFYKDWMNESNISPASFGDVRITNRGWRHMTRAGRTKSRILQSLLLLPSASRLLEPQHGIAKKRLTSSEKSILPNGQVRERFYEGVTARITFFQRHEAIVRVVLERNIFTTANGEPSSDESTLYSIYEIARRRSSV
ncbi:DUF4365 domain-containing protein [Luteimonas terrae]|uniref:DUF4365 domain-containing protein n=1 Tax=Luteimonas terrae TaxID=1530191 RepID=UPI0014052930|nr:DUF4365 domain-containing protein [Luteimonas terrae]